MTGGRTPTPRERLVFGALFGAVGLFIMGLSVADPASVNGPWWLGFAAGGVFAAAGLAVGTQGSPLGKWVGPLSVGLIFLAFAVLANWIAFGPGPRACQGGVSFLFFWASGSPGSLECRAAFGMGAIIVNGAVVMGTLTGVSKLVRDPVWATRLKKTGENILLVTLLPLLLPLLLFTVLTGVGKEAKERLLVRFRSGADGG